jgi:hypothetical protein
MGSSSTRPARLATLAICGVVVWTAGCGDSLDRAGLRRSSERIASLAAEGQLLGDDVSRDRTRPSFVRAHARELAGAADGQAERLADGSVSGDLAPARDLALVLALRVSRRLTDLQVRPADRATGLRASRELGRFAAAARRLPTPP